MKRSESVKRLRLGISDRGGQRTKKAMSSSAPAKSASGDSRPEECQLEYCGFSLRGECDPVVGAFSSPRGRTTERAK